MGHSLTDPDAVSSSALRFAGTSRSSRAPRAPMRSDVGSIKIRGVKRRNRPRSESRKGIRGRQLDVRLSMSATLTPRILMLPNKPCDDPNKGEARHRRARAVFAHSQGRIRDRSHDAQQKRVMALNLVIAAVVYWNTLYMPTCTSTCASSCRPSTTGSGSIACARVGPGRGARRPDRRGVGAAHGAKVGGASSRRDLEDRLPRERPAPLGGADDVRVMPPRLRPGTPGARRRRVRRHPRDRVAAPPLSFSPRARTPNTHRRGDHHGGSAL